MSLEQRLKEIRKACGLTQQALADRIGLKQNTIATYEIGRLQPSDRTISDICHELNVNETWLRTGEGEMFVKLSRSEEISAFMGDILSGEEDFRARLIAALARLTPEQWRQIEGIAETLVHEMQKKEAGQ